MKRGELEETKHQAEVLAAQERQALLEELKANPPAPIKPTQTWHQYLDEPTTDDLEDEPDSNVLFEQPKPTKKRKSTDSDGTASDTVSRRNKRQKMVADESDWATQTTANSLSPEQHLLVDKTATTIQISTY